MFLLCLAALTLFEKEAWAYVDPGSGLLIWQGLLAALFALLFQARRIARWLRRVWSKGEEILDRAGSDPAK